MDAHREAATAVELTVLGSGSAGNAALLATSETRILVDAGISRRKLRTRLGEAGIATDSLTAIVLTHEHQDHAGHAAKISAEYDCPVYMTHGTWAALEEADSIDRRECFNAGESFQIGDVAVSAFQVPHDARDPVGFRFRAEGVCLAYALDLGFLTTLVKQQFSDCACLLVEANYDIETLRQSFYPWEIKQRIWGRKGHLSNDEVKRFLAEDFDGVARDIVLAHLSENNNSPELARQAALEGLSRRANGSAGEGGPRIHVTHRNAVLPTIRF